MEHRTIVYNSARDGRLCRLRLFLDKKPMDEISQLIHAKTNGATPLIVASRNGHHEVVKYLVENCKVEIEQVGSVMFDGETIEGAPPLWCAAAAGHISVVKYLVDHGASVNKTTHTNSTPLRAACFDGHFEVVKYLISKNADIEISNRHGHTCLMISCYKKHLPIVEYLLKLKAEVNRKSVKGNTALHDCAESGSLDIMKLLLRNGAVMTKDYYNMTPLMAAAVAGYQPIVEFLIERQECTREERIEALELLGATYIDRKRDNMGALDLWIRAMKYRHQEGMATVLKPSGARPLEAYDFAVEAQSCSELQELVCDPDDMRMQALLVRERILGPSHPDTSYYIRYRGALYADMGNVERCISLWLYALEMQQTALEPLSPMTQSSFLSFAELFCFITSEWRSRNLITSLKFENLMTVLEGVTAEIKRGVAFLICQKESKSVDAHAKNLSNLNRLMVIVLHLLCLMHRLEAILATNDRISFKRAVYRLVKEDPRGCKSNSLLHLACSHETTEVGRYPICKFPSWDLVNLLIEVGADVNSQNSEGNTPLHIAANDTPCDRQIVKVLIESGCHIDASNKKGEIAADLVTGIPLYCIVPPMNFTSLQCLASWRIIKSGIHYKGIVGAELEKTVALHQGSLQDTEEEATTKSWLNDFEN